MKKINKKINFKNTIFSILFLCPLLMVGANDSSAPIIQPGAPGSPSKVLNEKEATDISNTSYINADVKFLQGMILHHEQAILMSNMATERTNNETILDLAKRIDVPSLVFLALGSL